MAESDDLFSDEIAQGEKLVKTLDEVKNSMIAILALSGKELPVSNPKNLDELQKLTAALEKIKLISNGLTETEKQLLVATEQLTQARKQAKDEIRAELSAYAKLSLEFKNAAQKAKDLAAAHGIESAAAKEAAAVAVNYNNKLKAIDESVGQHTRSVGDYAKGAKGLAGALHVLERITGINTSLLQESLRSTKIATGLQKAYSIVVGESAGAMKVFRLALAATGIGAVILLITSLVSSMDFLSKKAETAAEKVDRLTEELKKQAEAGQINNETLAEFEKATIEAASAQALLDEATQGVAKAMEDQKRLMEEIATFGRAKLSTEDIMNRLRTGADLSTVATVELNDALTELKNKQSVFTLDKAKEEFDRLNAAALDTKDLTADQIEELKKYKGLDVSIDGISQSYIQEKAELDKLIKSLEKETEVRSESDKSKLDKQKAVNKKFDDEANKAEEELTAMHKKSQKEVDNIEEEANRQADIDAQKVADDLKEYFALKKKLDNQVHQAAIADNKDAYEEAARQLKQLEDAEKKRKEQQLKDMEELSVAIFEGLEKRAENALAIEDEKIAAFDASIKEQQDRAKEGLSNTLAFEQAERAKALEERAKLEKQEKNRQELEELAKIFLDFVDAYAKSGDTNAEAKALGKTLAVRGISQAISGGLYEGTESVGEEHAILDLNRSKDSLLVPLHKGERVMGFEDSQKIKGISNDQLVRLGQLYKFGMLDAAHPVNEQSQMQAAMMKVAENYKSLEQTIKNKKELTVSRNIMGELIIEEKKDGIIRRGIQKDTKIIKRG